MGLIDTVKNALGGGEDEGGSDDIAEEFQEEIEQEESIEQEIEEEPTEEEGAGPWENAYRFAEDMLEKDGHADMMEFTKKVMFHEIETSPLYRDRIEQGVQTINQITSAKESIESLKGGGEKPDYGQKAEELRQVNRLMDEVDKLEGKEDEIVREALNVGKDLATGLARNVGSSGGNVESSVERRDESIE